MNVHRRDVPQGERHCRGLKKKKCFASRKSTSKAAGVAKNRQRNLVACTPVFFFLPRREKKKLSAEYGTIYAARRREGRPGRDRSDDGKVDFFLMCNVTSSRACPRVARPVRGRQLMAARRRGHKYRILLRGPARYRDDRGPAAEVAVSHLNNTTAN